jgi:hypothetical protein
VAVFAAPVSVKDLGNELHTFLSKPEGKSAADWHAMQAKLMAAEKDILSDAKSVKTQQNKEAVEGLVGLLKEWGEAQSKREVDAKKHMELGSLNDLAQGLYERRTLPKETQAAYLKRKDFQGLPVLKDLKPGDAPLYEQVSTWMTAHGYAAPVVHGAHDNTERGKKLDAIKAKVKDMEETFTAAAATLDPAARPQVEAALAKAKAAHNVKDELTALSAAVPLLKKRP